MSTLHIVNKQLEHLDCLQVMESDDALLFIEDGIYNVYAEVIHDLKNPIFVLEPDQVARNVPLVKTCQSISYNDFVILCTQYDKTISW